MHPAPSLILFTVLSGAGFGYLAFVGVTHDVGLAALFQFAFGITLAAAGLLASSFHLGNPQRALRAFTQWRSSWLSREAWVSLATLLCMTAVGASAVFFGHAQLMLGLLGSALAILTVFSTSMIYAQLKTVPRWNSVLTPLCFLATALAGGAILAGETEIAVGGLLLLGFVQVWAWGGGDGRFSGRGHSIASATGLGRSGSIRLFEGPHTGQNYLLNEFMHVVARRHAIKLRVLSIVLMCLLPALLLVSLPASPALIAVAFAVHLAGAMASRWLFFAEAEHVVRLYYGRDGLGCAS